MGEKLPRKRLTTDSFKETPLDESVRAPEPPIESAEENSSETELPESVRSNRIRENDSPEVIDMRKDAREKLTELVASARRAGKQPQELEGWEKIAKQFTGFNNGLDNFGDASDTDRIAMEPGLQRQYDRISGLIEEGLTEIADGMNGGVSLDTLENQPEVVLDVGEQISEEQKAENKAKLEAAVIELRKLSDPHDEWDMKEFSEYEKKRTASVETAPVAEAASAATPDPAEAPTKRGKLEDRAEVGRADTSEAAADFKRYNKKQKAQEAPTVETLPLAVPVGEAYVPEGVKTNEQLKKEFFDSKPKEVVKSMAEQLNDIGGGGEMIQRVAESERAARMKDYLAARPQELDKEAGKKFGEGSPAMNFLRGAGEKYNKLPLWSKIAIGAGLVGALAVSHGTGVAPFVYGALVAKRSWSGLGTFVKTENFLQKKSEQKESWWNKSAGGRALTGLAAGAGLAFGTSWGLNHLASWLATDTEWGKEANDWFKHLLGGNPGASAEHPAAATHFDPKATVEVRKGHGAISMVRDLKGKLEATYGTMDHNKIPPGARAVLEGDPTKLAMRLEAYQPSAALNSERIPLGAHLGISDSGALIYEAHGMDTPLTVLNADGTAGAAWDDHMMRPGAHHQAMSPTEKSFVATAEAASKQPISAEELQTIANEKLAGVQETGLSFDETAPQPSASHAHEAVRHAAKIAKSHFERTPDYSSAPAPEAAAAIAHDTAWAESHTSAQLQELVKNAPTMQPDASLTGGVGEQVPRATPYLLHDGHVAIFGGNGISDTELFESQKIAAQDFASKMNTDVLIRPETFGAPGSVVVHPNGTFTTVVRGALATGPHPQDVVMKLSE